MVLVSTVGICPHFSLSERGCAGVDRRRHGAAPGQPLQGNIPARPVRLVHRPAVVALSARLGRPLLVPKVRTALISFHDTSADASSSLLTRL